MANRLRVVMNELVSPQQSAFIRGRLIQDNILLAQDLVQNFHLDSKNPTLCLKLDLKKAFDNVNHHSLLQFMKKMGFHETWLQWTQQCIEKPQFSVLINGSPCGFFSSSNGLRQGDPLSPLLFCICMEMFTCIMEEALAKGSICIPFSKRGTVISHLLFADDLLIFAEATLLTCRGIRDCIAKFSVCSGLEVNKSKSEIFFSKGQNCFKNMIINTLNISEGELPIKYLGLPLITTRLSSSDCIPLLSKIRKRISTWSSKMLTRSGRLELTRSVLNSFNLFWSAVFHIPAATLNKIEQIFRNFIWGGSEIRNSYHTVNWATLYTPKAEGGLGIRRLQDISEACKLKQLWNIINDKQTLWSIWFKAKYIRRRNFWTLKPPQKMSWGARIVLSSREKAKNLICYTIDDGVGIDFWTQPWHPDGPLRDLYLGRRIFRASPNNVHIDEIFTEGNWNRDIINCLPGFLPLLEKVIHTPGSGNHAVWKPNPDGSFTIKTAWESLRNHHPRVPWFKSIWYHGHIPKHSFVGWQAILNKLSTRDKLSYQGPSRDIHCPLCLVEREDTNHLFFKCAYSAWIWRFVLWRFSYKRKPLHSLQMEEEWNRQTTRGKTQSAIGLGIAFNASIYHIWTERNKRIHEQRFQHKKSVLNEILLIIRSRCIHLGLNDLPSSRAYSLCQNLQLPLFVNVIGPKYCHWSPPETGRCKLNSDAALVGDLAAIGRVTER
ncbi:uncharacterized protein LOC143881252 [Tasmannia lanceolata]|uniref:uncharacterized protein LOC143881252 n=1 Tax=Tasmannia lanceolata TaxID=3420 RepID=UPI004063BDF7